MAYDGIHNITNKTQRHVSLGNNGTEKVIAGTSYDWAYSYKDRGHTQPHAPTHIGLRSFDYDANGNQTQWTHDQKGSRRSLVWDEENRLQSVTDNGTTSFKYDDQGQRVLKDGDTGQIAYLNQYYTVKNNAIPTKHVYAGTTRIVSKRLSGGNATTAPGNWNDTKRNNGKGNTPAPAATTPAPATTATAQADTPLTGPGKSNALQNRSARANERAQNTNKNPHLNGTGHPGQGINNRSDRANERAQNTVKNPNLNGAAVPPGNGVGNGSAGGNGNGNAGGNSAWQPEQHFLYYYHPDHLGSTSYVTDHKGEVYEHLQYFPFGETWIQQAHNTERTPYQYTSKELDEETGLYYYGARYYDPRTSVWQSGDPILGKYLPSGDKEQDQNLPGIGGVYRSININLYRYAGQNPLKIIDPNGMEDDMLISDPSTDEGIGRVGSMSKVDIPLTPAGKQASNVVDGVASYPRGVYRAADYEARYYGLRGPEEKLKARGENIVFKKLMMQAAQNPKLTAKIAMEAVKKNKAHVGGRLAAAIGVGVLTRKPQVSVPLSGVAAYGDMREAVKEGVTSTIGVVEAGVVGQIPVQNEVQRNNDQSVDQHY